MTLITSLLDGDRKLTKSEMIFVQDFLESYNNALSNSDYKNIENFFYASKINISIQYNDLINKYDKQKEYMGEIKQKKDFEKIYINFSNYAGVIEKNKIKSAVFCRPYDYPIDNIFYIEVEKRYSNIITKELFYISKDTETIYEHIIYIPKD